MDSFQSKLELAKKRKTTIEALIDKHLLSKLKYRVRLVKTFDFFRMFYLKVLINQ
jgi:hypothetical protein